jgi:hypothetical protein
MQAQIQQRQQEELIKELLKIEGKIVNTQVGKPEFMPEGSKIISDQVQSHGEAVQDQIEAYLGGAVESVLGVAPPPTVPPVHPVGQPKKSQFEGPIPGGQQRDSMRGTGQDMGMNKVGMSGV